MANKKTFSLRVAYSAGKYERAWGETCGSSSVL